MKNKFISIILVLTMLMVSACGNSTSKNIDADSNTEIQSTQIESSANKVTFTSTDINGNTISSNDLFNKYKLTMVNIWATFCGPCLREMPELEELSKKFNKEGYGLIGIIADSDTSIDEAKAIIKDMQISYPNVCINSDIDKALPTQVVPTTYFVDNEGNIVGSPMYGAPEHVEDQYTKELKDRLALLK